MTVPTTSFIDWLHIRLEYVQSAVPLNIFPELGLLADLPIAWWMGQVYRFAFQYTNFTQSLIERKIAKLKVDGGPLVGMHVRRTDKLWQEADEQSVESYMRQAGEYFDVLELSGPIERRRVFVATDDHSVIPEIHDKFPAYEVLTNAEGTKSNEDPDARNSFDALLGMLVDIEVLARCDFVVCTFSSNVCRLLYEIRMGRDPELFNRLVSLDYQYANYGERQQFGKVVAENHETRALNLTIGRRVPIAYFVNGLGQYYITKPSGYVSKLFVERRPQFVQFPISNV